MKTIAKGMENPFGKAICKQFTFCHVQPQSAARLQQTKVSTASVFAWLCSRAAANINIDCTVHSKIRYICQRVVPVESANTEYSASARVQ